MSWTGDNNNEVTSCNGKARRSNAASDGSSKSPSPKHPRPVTVEKVKLIMEQEGRSARNLLSWNIPMEDTHRDRSKIKRANANFMKYSGHADSGSERSTPKKFDRSASGDRKKPRDGMSRSDASPVAKPVSFRARYWAYLFENLRRAVDEIYATCQSDSSVVECKEVLLILDNYRHEFQALIDWIQLEEKLENTDISDRPTSLSWEVRKSSPGRPKQKRRSGGRGGASSPNHQSNMPTQLLQQHQRSKIYSNSAKNSTIQHPLCSSSNLSSNRARTKPPQQLRQPPRPPKSVSMPSVATWADRVKGVVPTHTSAPPPPPSSTHVQTYEQNLPEKEEEEPLLVDDGGGEWETVSSRGSRQSRNGNGGGNRGSQRSSFDSGSCQSKQIHSRSSPDLKLSPSSITSSKPMLLSESNKQINNNNKHSAPSQNNSNGKKKMQGKGNQVNNARVTGGGDAQENNSSHHIGINLIDETEAEYIAKANNFQDMKDEDVLATSGDQYSSSLTKLEEREASLARTLHAQHDASIAVAEERERDLMRQIREVEEENSADDTDCESARSSKELPVTEETTPQVKSMPWSEFLLMIKSEQEANAGVSWCDMVEQEENQLREPGSMVQMHEKLSSPSRKRTPAESRRKQEEKHRKAEVRRQEIEKARTQRLNELTEKVGEVRNWKDDLIRRQRDFLQCSQSEKLERAKEQREQKLRKIVQKAQAEDTKVNEIAFINELQEKNKRHEVLMRIDEHETRLQELESEKTKMLEMKSAKEENVKERRRAIEKERQDRIEELMVKRKEQDARIEQQRMEREKEREKVAKEKARDRELRLSALNAAHEEALSELQKKIQLKHNESERRHQEQLEIKKEKAVELSNVGRFSSAMAMTTPPNTPSATRIESSTSISSIKIDVESDVKSGRDSAANDVANSKDKNASGICSQSWRKAMKKRIKKLRQRMALRAKEFSKQLDANKQQQNNATNKNKVVRIVKDLNKVLTNHKSTPSGSWLASHVTSLDRSLNELVRILEKKNSAVDQNHFRLSGGFQSLEMIFNLMTTTTNKTNCQLPDKSLAFAVQVFHLACAGSHDNQLYSLYSNRLPSLVDLLHALMTRNEEEQQDIATSDGDDVIVDIVSPLIFKTVASLIEHLASAPPPLQSNPSRNTARQRKSQTLAELISSISLTDEKKATENYVNRGLDVISYVVASGVLELLSNQLRQVRNLVHPGSNISSFVENGLWFLEVTTTFVAMRNRLMKIPVENAQTTAKSGGDKSRDGSLSTTPHETDDPTHLLPILQYTELMGVVSVLYGLLLNGAPERPTALNSEPDKPQETIPSHTLCVARAVMRMLNAAAEMDLLLVQQNLGAEGVALEFRHICAYLLWYCSNTQLNCNLLHEVIVCIGNFSLSNKVNQDLVNSGVQPTIVQQLGLLPFAYYSDPKLTHVLFPTLISCCYNNDNNFSTLENEVSGSILATYIESELKLKKKPEEAESAKEAGNLMRNSHNIRSLAESNRYTEEMLQNAITYFSHQIDGEATQFKFEGV